MEKYLIRVAVLVGVLSLTSCGLAQSVLKIPGSILQTVGRTAGMNVSHESDKTEEGVIDPEDTARFD